MASLTSSAFPLLFFLYLNPLRAQEPAFSGSETTANSTVLSFPNNEQLRHFKAMSDPRLAPDGKRILIRITDATADAAKSHLWLSGVDGEDPRQLTYSPGADKRGEYEGEWMPDGQSILFLAKRGDHTLLYRLPMNGGEAKTFELKVKPVVDQANLPDALPPKGTTHPEDPKSTDASSKLKTDAKSDAKDSEVPIDVARYQVSPNGMWITIIANDPQRKRRRMRRPMPNGST
jgi:hypothetical protein